MLVPWSSSARDVGPALGVGLGVALALLSTAKCASLLKRPRMNRLGVTALLLVCVAWAVNVLSGIAAHPTGTAKVAVMAGIVLARLLLLAGIVLGITALAAHDRERHSRGRGQALTAIVVGVLALGWMGWSFARGLHTARRTGELSTGETLRLTRREQGFELTCPRPWVNMRPDVVNPNACVALRRVQPEMWLVVIAEHGRSIEQPLLVELSLANMDGVARVDGRRREEVELGGLAFTRVVSRMSPYDGEVELADERWILARPGFAWQIIAWTAAGEAEALAREVRPIVASFRLLDATPGSPAPAAPEPVDPADVRAPLEQVTLPDELLRVLAQESPPDDFGRGEAFALLQSTTGYEFQPGMPLRTTHAVRARVLTPDGAARLSSLEVRFDALAERLHVDRAEVRNSAGQLVARASDDAYVTAGDPQGRDDGARLLHQPIPGVKTGCTVEWQVTFEQRTPAGAFPFRREFFGADAPLAVDVVFVRSAPAGVQAVLVNGAAVRELEGQGFRAWIARASAPLVDEPLAADPERWAPLLFLGGGNASWKELGTAYLADIADVLAPDPSLVPLASQLTRGHADERARVAALAAHVQRELSYQALEFGAHTRRPNAVAETLRLRFGDCKDHALLLAQLLGAAGIQGQLALVSSRGLVRPELPSLDQFDHMIVRVPSLGDGGWIDATDKRLDLARYPPDVLRSSPALVLDPAEPRLVEPPARPADGYWIDSRRTLVPEGADWRVEETLTLHGYPAAWARALFAAVRPAERARGAQDWLSKAGPVRVLDFRFANLDALDEPAELTLVYRVPDAVHASGEERWAALPACFERVYLDTPFLAARRTPWAWELPLHFTSTVTMALPGALTPDALEALTREAQDEFCAWHLTPAPPEGEAAPPQMRFEFEGRPGAGPPASYAAFHEAWEAALRAWGAPVRWLMPR